MRHDPTEATVQAQATAMVSSGLKSAGYRYVNVDDYVRVPRPPPADRRPARPLGRQPGELPLQGSLNGIQATAAYVHHLGLKFGIYVTPGISAQAVARNSPIAGTRDTAEADRHHHPTRTTTTAAGWSGSTSRPGAQAFVNSWANELASLGRRLRQARRRRRFDIPDIQAWSTRAAPDRSPDPPRAVQQPQHPGRADLGALRRRLAHRP